MFIASNMYIRKVRLKRDEANILTELEQDWRKSKMGGKNKSRNK